MISNIISAINDAHATVEAAKKAVIVAAVECGQLLSEAKATVRHGEWESWVKAHCTFSSRTAQLYMQIAEWLGDGDGEKAQRVADLSLREIAKVVSRSRARAERPALSAAQVREFDEMVFLWASMPPAGGKRAAEEIHRLGDISDVERNKWLRAADAAPQRDPAGALQEVVSVMQSRLPADDLQRIISLAKRHKLTVGELANAFDAVVSERRQAAP